MSTINLTLSVEATQWEVLREKLLGFAHEHQLTKHDQYYLLLICEEWFFNIVSHGFPPSHSLLPSQSSIQVMVSVINEQIEIIFLDEGIAFNPFEKDVNETITASIEQQLGGLGLYFIIKLLAKYYYSYEHNKNKTTMYYAIEKREN